MNTAPYAANAFSSAPWECFWPYVSALTPAATPLRSTLVCTRCQTFWIREFRRDSCVSQIHHGNSCDPDDLSGKFLPSPFMQRGQWPRAAAAALAALQDRGLRHHSSKIKPYQADPRFSNLPTCLADVALPRFTSDVRIQIAGFVRQTSRRIRGGLRLINFMEGLPPENARA